MRLFYILDPQPLKPPSRRSSSYLHGPCAAISHRGTSQTRCAPGAHRTRTDAIRPSFAPMCPIAPPHLAYPPRARAEIDSEHDASSPARPRAAHEGAECDAGTKAQQSEAPKAATAVGVRPPRPVTTADFFLGSVIFVLCTFKSLWCCLRPVFSVMLTARTHTPIRILQPNTKTLGR